MTEFHHTGQLEVFHSMMLKYVPKRQHFSYQGMVARTQLAALDHNYNLNRSQAVISNENDGVGEERYKVVFPKGLKDWVAKPVLKDKSYEFFNDLMYDVVTSKLEKRHDSLVLPQNIPRNIAPKTRPEKSVVISRHKSRFRK